MKWWWCGHWQCGDFVKSGSLAVKSPESEYFILRIVDIRHWRSLHFRLLVFGFQSGSITLNYLSNSYLFCSTRCSLCQNFPQSDRNLYSLSSCTSQSDCSLSSLSCCNSHYVASKLKRNLYETSTHFCFVT